MFDIKIIDSEMTYNIRHKVLRPNQPIEDSKYDTDNQENSFHVGGFHNGQLISIVSFCIQNHPDFSSETQYRLRAMATLEGFRNKGVGRHLVDYAENIIKKRGYDFLWCNARTSAQQYYNKLGFKPHGEVYDQKYIGPHIILYKELDVSSLLQERSKK